MSSQTKQAPAYDPPRPLRSPQQRRRGPGRDAHQRMNKENTDTHIAGIIQPYERMKSCHL